MYREALKRRLWLESKAQKADGKVIAYFPSIQKLIKSDVEHAIWWFKLYRGYPWRQLRYAWFGLKFKIVARFITKHALWWNSEDAKRWQKFV